MTLEDFVPKIMQAGYEGHGRTYKAVDCWGLVYLAYRDILGIHLPSYADQYTKTDISGTRELSEVVQAVIPNWTKVEIPRPMDVAVFLICNRPVHTGLILDDTRFLHAEYKMGVFVERLESPVWARRLDGFYRHGK